MFLGINLDIPDAPQVTVAPGNDDNIGGSTNPSSDNNPGAPTESTATLYPSIDEADTIEPPVVTASSLTRQ